MDKKIFLHSSNINSSSRNTVTGLTVNNGNSDYAILYDNFNEELYGYQSSTDQYIDLGNVPAKVIISTNAHNSIVSKHNIIDHLHKDIYGNTSNGYSADDDTKIINMKERLGNLMNTRVKAMWMKDKLPQGVQTNFEKYFAKNVLNNLTDNPKDNDTNNAIKKLLNEYS